MIKSLLAVSLFNSWKMDKGQARRLSYEINPCPSFPPLGWERHSVGSADFEGESSIISVTA
ncbi:MAG: hypothetical protein MUC60_01890 [Oscillatoria sp. Prado101]|jgi:hypothetical protein|nr:hypothetical protein [Oscillatoria sp. Prado101]